MDEPIKTARDNLHKQVEDTLQQGETVEVSVMSLYVQFKILEMLDSIDSRLIGVENAVSNVEEAISNLNRGHV